jgi:FKBP-type peptidyl-prolyl cis-trans isomerase FklB
MLLLGLVAVATIACKEVKEADEYDNWKERNQLFVDSISNLASGKIVVSEADADAMQVGTYYAIETNVSTNRQLQFIYVKKLLANTEGKRAYYTDKASVFYYGTNINGSRFDGNFEGYNCIDKSTLDGNENLPTQFNMPTEFAVNGSIISGWKTALQYMREGERWMVYVPYQSAYGKNGNGSILGYTMLCFDMIVDEVKRQ